MPVEFLSDEQVAAYGRFDGVPTQTALERFFFLDDADRVLISRRRGDHNRLGFAVQLGTVRCLGTFLADPVDVPWPVVDYLAGQLGIADVSCVKRYSERPATQWEHAAEIRGVFGYRDFSDAEAAGGLRAFLASRAWTNAEGPVALFDQAVAWLRRERVLLPGASVLARLVSSVREAAADRLYQTLTDAAVAVDPELPGRLRALLEVPTGARVSELERLRRAPTRMSGPAMEKALDRVAELAGLGARAVEVSVVPAARLAMLARYGLTARAPTLRALAEPRRTATLVAAVRRLETTAVDDALDLFDVLMATRLLNPARRASERERLAALPRLEKASVTLAAAARAVLDVLATAGERVDVAAAWAAVERVAPRERVLAAAAVVEELVPDDAAGEAAMRAELTRRYGTVRPFLLLVAEALPRVDLPDLLLEVHAWTGFLDAYTHLGGLGSRMDGMHVSIAALLVAEACNVGLTPVTKPGEPALTRDRLSHVDQNYLRADTHAAAQAAIPVARTWGGGLVASVDGLRFVVPVKTINAGPSPRYFGLRRGVTWLNAVNDQVAGIGAVVVPGTVRDSLYILDTLLNLDAGPKPEMVATDTASYSDIVFGLFRLLGYRFSPRIADLSDQRFWRATLPGDVEGDYGPLNAIARHRINLTRIRTHWPDMLRVAGSLVTNQLRAYDLLRMLGREGHPSPLGQAFVEYGRIAKTLHLLAVIDPMDETYRRTVATQLTVQESRHRLARKIFHGQRGELRQAYREGQEDQLGALGLVLNAVVLWNTRYTDAAVTALREAGQPVDDADVARLSPLVDRHINMLGRYAFTSPPRSGLRPLRDPTQPDEE